MRLLIITSCTGEKTVESEHALTLDDFVQGPEHIARRERELGDLLIPAKDLYSGMQHVRLMRGIRAVREHTEADIEIDLRILSAGYGLVEHDRRLASYEATFNGMKKAELHTWAERLDIPASMRRVLDQPYDLGLILLGDSHLETCRLDETVRLGGPTLLFCGQAAAKRLPSLERLRVVPLGNADARRFSCGLVGLKGELAHRLLQALADGSLRLPELIDPEQDMRDLLAGEPPVVDSARPVRHAARANPKVDRVIEIPESWHHKLYCRYIFDLGS